MDRHTPVHTAGRLSLVLSSGEARLLWTMAGGKGPTSIHCQAALNLRARGLARRARDGSLHLGPPVASMVRTWREATLALHLHHWSISGQLIQASGYAREQQQLAHMRGPRRLHIFHMHSSRADMVQQMLLQSHCAQLRGASGGTFHATHAQLQAWQRRSPTPLLDSTLPPAPYAVTLFQLRVEQQQTDWLMFHTADGGWKATPLDAAGSCYQLEPTGASQLRELLHGAFSTSIYPAAIRQPA